MSITAPQCRAARALLNWTGPDLCFSSSVSVPTISRFERGVPVSPSMLAALRYAFEKVGIEFLTGDGVRRRVGTVPSVAITYALGNERLAGA